MRFERIPIVGSLYTRNARRFPRAVRYGDIVKGLPIKEESCPGIYCSHILEHLAFDDMGVALDNTFRYLKPDGTFRLVVPDLRKLAEDYLASSASSAATTFMEDTGLGKRHRIRGWGGLMREWLGNSSHLWMWDEGTMAEKLKAHGFRSIRRCQFGDAIDRKFDDVENRDRFIGCLGMECKK